MCSAVCLLPHTQQRRNKIHRCLRPILERLEERKSKGEEAAAALRHKQTVGRMHAPMTIRTIRREGQAKSAGRMVGGSEIAYKLDGEPRRSEWMRVLASHHGLVLLPSLFCSPLQDHSRLSLLLAAFITCLSVCIILPWQIQLRTSSRSHPTLFPPVLIPSYSRNFPLAAELGCPCLRPIRHREL